MTKCRRGKLQGVALGLILSCMSASAAPTRQEVYRDDRLGLIVYTDGQDENTYWYLPLVKVCNPGSSECLRGVAPAAAQNAKSAAPRFRSAKATGEISYNFYLVPHLPEDLIEVLSYKIPGLQHRSQLKPVVAKKFAIQLPEFKKIAESGDVTNYMYLNKPQLMRFRLTPDEAEDFDELYNLEPGIPAHVIISYESEKVSGYAQLKMSCAEVADELKIGVRGGASGGVGKTQVFTRAQIENAVRNEQRNKGITLRTKGEQPGLDSLIGKLLDLCFIPVRNGQYPYGGYPGYYDPLAPIVNLPPVNDPLLGPSNYNRYSSAYQDSAENLEAWMQQLQGQLEAESVLEHQQALSLPRPEQTGIPPLGGDYPPTDDPGNGAPRRGAELTFMFKKEVIDRKDLTAVSSEQMVDVVDTAVVHTYLTVNPAAQDRFTFQEFPERNLRVPHTATKADPLKTGIIIGKSDQWIIDASFVMEAESKYNGGKKAEYRWASEASPENDLYYRIGTGRWFPVKEGRVTIGTDLIQGGELQFYIDREAIWKKIPEKYKKGKAFGLSAPIFEYSKVMPNFAVRMNGRKMIPRQ